MVGLLLALYVHTVNQEERDTDLPPRSAQSAGETNAQNTISVRIHGKFREEANLGTGDGENREDFSKDVTPELQRGKQSRK